MKLWVLKQDVNDGYDTYDSMVVAAETEDAARQIHPWGSDSFGWDSGTWASSPDQVSVSLIGEADASVTEPGVILASFNAG